MRSEEEVEKAIEQYGDMVRRICMVHLKNHDDSEDIFQTVFMKYLLASDEFESERHEKAWIIRVTINSCKDLLKSFFKKNTVSIDEVIITKELADEHREVLEAVLSLPLKYREVIYLYYYEGYSAVEIGNILNKNVNTIYTHLSRAKEMLKDALGDEENE